MSAHGWTMATYDKAKWHLAAVDALDGDYDDAFAPAAYFFAWAAENGLLSAETRDALEPDIEALRRRETCGIRFFKIVDGVLDSRDLNSEGDRFAMSYIDYRSGSYLSDLRSLASHEVTDEAGTHDPLYFLGWRWDIYELFADLASKRFEAWKAAQHPDG